MNTRSMLLRTAAGVIAMSVTVAVAGCSSNDPKTASNSPSDSGSTQTFKPGPTPKGTPITIGVVATETGPTAGPYSGIHGVAQAWAAWMNDANGGLGGHPVKVVYADDKGAPADATSAVRKMVENDHAVAIFLGSSVGSGVVSEYLAGKGIPEISADQGQRAPDGPTSWFTTDLGMPAVAQSAADVAKDAGYDSVAAAVCSEVPACAGIGDLMKAYGPTIGVDYKGLVTIAGSATSATAQCLEIVNSGAKAVAAFIGLNASLKIIQTCQTQGYKGGFVQLAWADSIISKLPGTQLGVLYSFPWWSDAAPVAEYRNVINQYASGTDYKASGSGTMWAQLSLFRYAVEKSAPAESASVSGADVLSAFRTVKDVTLDGLLPQPITYTEAENTTIKCFWPVKHEADGTYSTLQGSWTSGNGATGDLASQCVS
jgi:branched-chain amino acid transport system substrate-binding protein